MPRETFQKFSLKFIDVMVGVVLGLGFQWWPELHEPWQYVAFIFVYLNLIDYWIDYSPTLRKYPPRREVDLIVHISIIFTMFLLVYATRGTITAFLITFIVYRVADILWTLNIRREYKPVPEQNIFIDTWFWMAIIEAVGTGFLFLVARFFVPVHPLIIILLFMIFRISTRVLASMRYKRIFFE